MSAGGRGHTRRVLATAAIYTAAAWAGAEALLTVVDRFGLPAWLGTLITALFVAGLPVTVFLVWRTAGADRRASAASVIGSVIFLAVATAALFWLTRPEPLPAPRAVAIIPCDFEGEGAYAYRAEGLAEDVHARLSRVDAIRLLSWNSSLYVRDKGYAAERIAEVLAADRLVLCRMHAASDRIDLTTSVVDPVDQTVLWNHSYAFAASDLGTVVTELAGTLLDVLGTTAMAAELERVKDLGTFSPEAYDLVLQAGVERDVDRAERLLRRALEIDPEYAQALVRLGDIYLERAYSREFEDPFQPHTWALEARALSQRALAIDNGIYDARRNLVEVCFLTDAYYNEPCPPGEEERLNREECEVRGKTAEGWACWSRYLKDEAESLAALRHWLELEPTSWEANAQLIWHYWAAEANQGKALSLFDTMRALYPDDARTFGLISNLLRREGRFDEVLAWRYAAFKSEIPDGPWQLARLGTDYLNLDLKEQALAIGLRTWESRRASAIHFLPQLWVETGDPDKARDAQEWLAEFHAQASGTTKENLSLAAFYAATLHAYELAKATYENALAGGTLQQLCPDADCVVHHALVLAHVEKALGHAQQGEQWQDIAEQAAANIEAEGRLRILLDIGRGQLQDAVTQLREYVFGWRIDDGELAYPLLFLEQDALLDPLRELPEFQRLMEDYRAHLAPQQQRVLAAEAAGDWEPLRQRVFERNQNAGG